MNTCHYCGVPIEDDDYITDHVAMCRRDDEAGCSCNRLAHLACVEHGDPRDGR